MSMSNDEILTPPLKWAGGKRWLAPVLTKLYETHRNRRYVEPFCGGLAIALALQPRIAYLNDVNQHLINFYRHIKLHGLHMTTKMMYNKNLYYDHRKLFNQYIKDQNWSCQKAAELFYYLNRTCFNGLCRFNQSGFFNVPFGQYTTVNYVTNFEAHQKAFKSWSFMDDDFEKVSLSADDFIYADPPYDVEFTTYSAGGFDWNDQHRLYQWLLRHPGPVVVSNQATPRILDLYNDGFKIELLSAPRRISRTGDRTPAQEMLAIRNL